MKRPGPSIPSASAIDVPERRPAHRLAPAAGRRHQPAGAAARSNRPGNPCVRAPHRRRTGLGRRAARDADRADRVAGGPVRAPRCAGYVDGVGCAIRDSGYVERIDRAHGGFDAAASVRHLVRQHLPPRQHGLRTGHRKESVAIRASRRGRDALRRRNDVPGVGSECDIGSRRGNVQRVGGRRGTARERGRGALVAGCSQRQRRRALPVRHRDRRELAVACGPALDGGREQRERFDRRRSRGVRLGGPGRFRCPRGTIS